MENLKLVSYFMMVLLVFGSFAPFATAAFSGETSQGFTANNYGSTTNTWQSSRPTFDSFYSGSMSTYWPILTRLENDQCNSTTSDFVIMIPPFGCSPQVVTSDLLAEQNVPVFCQLSAIKINPLIDVSTIKSISFKGDYPEEVAGISFHPARAAVNSYKTLLGDPIEENIGYVVIVLKRQPDERNLEENISGMLTATIKYDAQGTFGTGAGEYYLESTSDEEWEKAGVASSASFWGGKGYLRATSVESNEATIEILTSKDDVYKTVTLKEGETSSQIYYPGYYCTASLKLKLNKIDNSEDMAKIDIDGDSYWVRKGSKFLDGKCTVKDLNVFPGGSGSVEISCSGSSVFKLMLGDRGAVLNNGTTDINVMIGGSIKTGNTNYYLGYYGKNEKLKVGDNENGEFIVLFDKIVSEDEVSDITRIFETGNFETKDELGKALDGVAKFKGKYEVISLDKTSEKGDITFVSMRDELSDGKYTKESFIPEYMKKAEETTLQLVDNFASEKKDNGEYWGEDALYQQIMLAGVVEDTEMQTNLIERFLKEYPGSANVEYLRDLKLRLARYNYEGSSKNVFVNNDNYNIRVDGFVSGGGENDGVEVNIGGAKGTLKRGKIYDKNLEEITNLDKQKSEVPRLTVVDIDGSSAKFDYVFWKDKDEKGSSSKTVSVDVGSYTNVGGETIRVVKTNVREVAYVSLIPEIRNTKTEANFTFNIGIEKRAIELSPEKAQKKVDALNKSIADWEDRLEKLGKLITGLKGACLGISTVLTLKNLFTGFVGGTASARKPVMDYYEKECRENHAGMDLNECYNTYYKDKIESAIDDYGNAMLAVNKEVECAETGKTVGNKWGTTEVVNQKLYVDELKKCTNIGNDWNYKIDNTTIYKKDLNEAREIQAVLLRDKACEKPESTACKMAEADLKKIMEGKVGDVNKLKLEEELGVSSDDIYTDSTGAKQVTASVTTEETGKKPIYGQMLSKGTYYKIIQRGGDYYLYTLKEDNGLLTVDVIYDKNGNPVTDKKVGTGTNEVELKKLYNFKIPPAEDNSCSNTINKPYVKYYESANKQGFAAIVPFDLKEGWYAYVEKNGYTDSGVPTAFWICNVGRDGIISDGAQGGDSCQLFQSSSVGMVDNFIPCPKNSPDAVKKLYTKAQAAIAEANRNGNGLSVDGQFIHKTAPLAPASVGADCTDFMSLDDCALMFNVCDPVICPTSRCNLGGAAPVNDVIASGVIGSLVLCLPNFGNPGKGKVLIPICLSGVHAGLDAYVSILKSYKSCLEKNIATGEYVGICDEITSIYMCEFFWGQLSPILDILLVRFVEGLYGGFQVRGGAEYLTIQKSFENLDNSINYFASTYTGGALRAFSVGSTEEIGSMICKGFVGSSVPTSADMLDSFLKPDSPTQFYAYFSDTVFSEATVPSTSHYKVYYHIYAGNDEGVQFRVYLKSPPETSYYSSRPTLLVKSGYAEKGVAADEAIDFTAPTGYKELCVSINGRDECGFGSVTSDFGLKYVSQEYVADQADDRQISKTEDCVTTSTSAWGMANPNLQEGVEKSIGGDDIATTGIIRVCASTNPEQGVMAGSDVYCKPSENKSADGDNKASNPRCEFGYSCEVFGGDIEKDIGVCINDAGNRQVSAGRWVDVGYCDTESVRCWLDKNSVEDNLDTYMAINNITSVNDLTMESKDLKELKESYDSARVKLGEQREELKKLEFKDGELKDKDMIEEKIKNIITKLDEVAGVERDYIGQGSNADKAEALALKASVYMTVVRELLKNNPEKVVVGAKEEAVVKDEETEKTKCEECKPENPWGGLNFYCSEEECMAHADTIGKECVWGMFSGCKDVEEEVGDGDEGGVESVVEKGDSGDGVESEVEIEGIKLPPPTFMDRLKNKDILGRLGLYESYISNYSEIYNVPVNLIKAIIIQESVAETIEGGQCIMDKGKTSFGLMQVSKLAATDVGMSIEFENMKNDNNCRPISNIKIGTAYYAHLRETYYKDINEGDNLNKITLAAYNWGLGNINKNCENKRWENCKDIPEDVLQYVSNIMAYEKGLGSP